MTKTHVVSTIAETEEAMTFVLNPKPKEWHYEPGQHITVEVTIDGIPYRRSYSLATPPGLGLLPAITVKRIPNGKVSNYLCDRIKKGDTLLCSEPKGHFLLNQPTIEPARLVLIAGGSGITPLYAMLQATLQRDSAVAITLLYASRREESIIYKKQLAELAEKHSQRLTVTHILSQPGEGWQGIKGRLTAASLVELLPVDSPATHYYLCAPQGLMECARATLLARGVEKCRIRQEPFSTTQQDEDFPYRKTPATVTFLYQGAKMTAAVEPDDSLLDTAHDLGIDIPYSCSSGICDTCRVKCIKGEVKMMSDEGLSKEEKESGYVLTCVGYAGSDEVTIEVEGEAD